ncbi:MAG: 4-hydroxy-3-methylbut-2-enyl diphosphate reductase [Spirochaetales bacterium]|nr:4-hydroxy-3-methylbut-2-enyl diphosphate reductase [Spirochaetales bacterium]
MKVIRSKVIGFCFGVSNTVAKADECIALARESGLPCYSIGELIHNKDMVRHYNELGMVCVKGSEGIEPGVALVRAHGIPDRDRRGYEKRGFRIVDSTCPIVAKGAQTIRKAAQKGIKTMIVGVKGHAETIGLQGVEASEGKVVDSIMVYGLEDAERLVQEGSPAADEPIVVVVQTTFPVNVFERIKKVLKGHFTAIRFSNSPCGATQIRKKAALELARQTDAVVVVGGRNSENTKGLARTVEDTGKPVYCIENASDLDKGLCSELSTYRCVGICSGSSTPTNIIREVEEVLERL